MVRRSRWRSRTTAEKKIGGENRWTAVGGFLNGRVVDAASRRVHERPTASLCSGEATRRDAASTVARYKNNIPLSTSTSPSTLFKTRPPLSTYFLHLFSFSFLTLALLSPALAATPTLPTELSGYIKDGLIAFWDGTYNSTNAQGEACHDSTTTTWIDLSGNGHDAKKANGAPWWGENYLCTTNTDGSGWGRYDYTPNATFLAAINAGTFAYEVVFKIHTWVTDNGVIGCRDNGGTWGLRADSSGNNYFAVKGAEIGFGGYKANWLAGCSLALGANGKTYAALMNGSPFKYNEAFYPGSSPTKGNGRIGASCAQYSNQTKANIYLGRVYSRELTGVELFHNGAIDRVRYFGATERTTRRVSSYGYPYGVRYGSPSPAYDTLTEKAKDATQSFSVASTLTTYDFDNARATKVNNDATRAVYLGATLTTIDDSGVEVTTDYAETTESLGSLTTDKDMFAVWKWNLQYRLIASAAKGGKIVVNDAATSVGAYTNWYDASAATSVTVTAVPDEGYGFNGWTGSVTGDPSELATTITMNQGRTITATFVRTGKGDGSTYHWKGGGSSTDWFNADNWAEGLTPLETDHVVITSTVAQTVSLAAATPRYASITIGGGPAVTTLTLKNWSTVLDADTVTIAKNGVVQPVAAFTDAQMSNRVWITCNAFTLASGGKINASSLGWCNLGTNARGAGPGGGVQNRGGGGYGGTGGPGYNRTTRGKSYGSLVAPEDPGSGGGHASASSGGAAGGAVRIAVAGHAKVDGAIRADGSMASSSWWGGGSGGGVYISCATFEGTGTITARGGVNTQSNTGGGGGRIAIVWSDTEGQKAYSPAPILHVGARWYGTSEGYPPTYRMPTYGEVGNQVGTHGTIYLTDDSFYPGAIWMKCAGEFHFGTQTKHSYELDDPGFVAESSADTGKLEQDLLFYDLDLSFPSGLTLPKYTRIIFKNCTVSASSISVNAGCLDMRGNSTLTVAGDLVASGTARLNFDSGATNGVKAATWNPWGQIISVGGTLWLKDTAILYPGSHSTNGGAPDFRLGGLVVASGATIYGITRGFGKYDHTSSVQYASWGPGSSGAANIGPAHGGYGGGAGTQNRRVYGDAKHPTLAGTDGGRWNSYVGGWGGGLFHATVKKTARIDGTINMNGQGSYNAEGCGSSGGGIYVNCELFTGAGKLRANGAGGTSSTSYSGSGGGGRIAVIARTFAGWTGTMTVEPGTNAYTYASTPTIGTLFVKRTGGLMIMVK